MTETPTLLLLEDQPLLSWELEDLIRGAGLAEPFTVSSCAAASSWLDSRTPDLAVLDILVADGETVRVAETLSRRGVPFIVHSARSRSDKSPNAIFLKGIWVPKLAGSEAMLQALSQCRRQPTAARQALDAAHQTSVNGIG